MKTFFDRNIFSPGDLDMGGLTSRGGYTSIETSIIYCQNIHDALCWFAHRILFLSGFEKPCTHP